MTISEESPRGLSQSGTNSSSLFSNGLSGLPRVASLLDGEGGFSSLVDDVSSVFVESTWGHKIELLSVVTVVSVFGSLFSSDLDI